MSTDIEQVRLHLQDLGRRINLKVEELHKQGVLHGPARQAAAEFQIRHASAIQRAADHTETLADELAADAEILKHSFERWVASVDRRSES